MEVVPDNPDLAFVLPQVDALKHRAHLLAEHRVLRLPFIKGTTCQSSAPVAP